MRRNLPLTGIIALAALLRLPAIGSRSLWLDEGAEWFTVRGSLGHLMDRVIHAESTPPLSFIYEWAWVKAIGTSEVALRVPFALLGIALVPVVYVAARELAGRRAGLLAAALAACNPMLVWHAQDARSYTLLALLLAGTIVALARERWWWWAGLATAALATHHFAIFIVAPEAVWLLRVRGRCAWRHLVPPAIALVPLGLLAASQSGARSSWIAGLSLVTRLAQIPAAFVAGYQLGRLATAAAGVLVLAAVLPALWRARRSQAGRLMLALGLIGIALPLLAIVVGEDFLIQRNVIGSLLALMIAAGIGFAAMRHGIALVAGVCVIWIAITVATAGEPKFRREDWRGAMRAAGAAQAAVLVPRSAFAVAGYYRHRAVVVPAARVRSLALVRMGQTTGTGCRIPLAPALPAAPRRGVARGRCWQVDLLAWPTPRTIAAGDQTLVR